MAVPKAEARGGAGGSRRRDLEAEPLRRRDLEARERILGPAHCSTLIALNNLASVLRQLGKLSEVLLPLCWALGGGPVVLPFEEKVDQNSKKTETMSASQVFQIFSDFFILSLFMEKCLQINTCSHHLRSAIYKSSRQWTCQSGQAKTVLRERLVAVLFLFLVSTR